MEPHEFNVVLRTTTDEFNVIPICCFSIFSEIKIKLCPLLKRGSGVYPRGKLCMLLSCWRVLVAHLWRTKTIACGNWLKFGYFSCSSLKNNWQNHCQSENSRGGNCLLLPHAGYAYGRNGGPMKKWGMSLTLVPPAIPALISHENIIKTE